MRRLLNDGRSRVERTIGNSAAQFPTVNRHRISVATNKNYLLSSFVNNEYLFQYDGKWVEISLSIVIKPHNDSARNHSLLICQIENLGKFRNKMFVVKAKSDFAAKRVEYLYDAMKKEKKCDTVFTVRKQSIHAHLIILMACSEFFGENEGLVEGIFSDFNNEVIEAILKHRRKKHRKKLMQLAKRLKVNIPPQFKTVDISNCLNVFKLTYDSELKKKAMDLITENFWKLYKTQNFLNLTVSSLIEILKSDYLVVFSEKDVFNSVKLWIQHDNVNRKNKLAQVMSYVRLSLLSIQFLLDEVMTFCHLSTECMTSIKQAIKDKNDKSFIQTETLRIIKNDKLALVGGLYKSVSFISQSAKTIDIYDGINKTWTLSKDIEIGKSGFASVIVRDWIVIIGGASNKWDSLNSVDYIDLKNGQKHSLKTLNQARWVFSAVSLRRDSSTDIYAIGGMSDTYLSSVERWSSNTGDWEIIAPLLVAVDRLSASVIDGKIYVTGGRTSEDGKTISLNKVQTFSVKSNSWTYRAPMIQTRHGHSSVAFKGKLFVAGGITEQTKAYLDSVEHYDPIANVWTAFTTLPKPMHGISLCVFQDKLLSMGGGTAGIGSTSGHLDDVWEYNETGQTWKALKKLNKSRYLPSGCHEIPYDSII
ncbi:kelch-like protein 24 [Arctopsyche grandis]|uniref:kelch-like protein 24 n=1 Tax=Arctopsyche grandis TaxID=121162 RepID=UPI00406D843D